MISYFIFGIISITTVYYILRLKKQHQKALDEVDWWNNEIIKQKVIYIQEQSTIIAMQKNILFHISDGIHNFGSMMLRIENENIEAEYFNKLNRFFSISRTLAINLSKDLYSKEEYKEILKFIQQDFHDYFHGGAKHLDLEKYYKLIMIKGYEIEGCQIECWEDY